MCAARLLRCESLNISKFTRSEKQSEINSSFVDVRQSYCLDLKLRRVRLMDGIQMIQNTIYYTVWISDGYGKTFVSSSSLHADNLLHIISLLIFRFAHTLTLEILHVTFEMRSPQWIINFGTYKRAKQYHFVPIRTAEVHDYRNRSNCIDICCWGCVAVAQFHYTTTIFEVAKFKYAASSNKLLSKWYAKTYKAFSYICSNDLFYVMNSLNFNLMRLARSE